MNFFAVENSDIKAFGSKKVMFERARFKKFKFKKSFKQLFINIKCPKGGGWGVRKLPKSVTY